MWRKNYGQIVCFDDVKIGAVFQTDAFYRYGFFFKC
jgi:hypothetical protein